MVVRGDGSLVGPHGLASPRRNDAFRPRSGGRRRRLPGPREGLLDGGTWVVDMAGRRRTSSVSTSAAFRPVGPRRHRRRSPDAGEGHRLRTVASAATAVSPPRERVVHRAGACDPPFNPRRLLSDVHCRLEARLAPPRGEEPLFLLPGPKWKGSSLRLDGPVLLGDHLAAAAISRRARREVERLEKEGVVRFPASLP